MRKMARGEGKAGCLFYALLALVVGFIAVKALPVQVAKMELEDYMRELAMTSPRKGAAFFKDRIVKRAADLDLPVKKKDIKINKSSRRVVMDVEFTVVLDLVFTEYPWSHKIHLDREIFLM